MFRSLTELKDYWMDNGFHYCRIDMPCSFQHGDGIPCSVEACAETKAEASESACLRALAHILDVNQKLLWSEVRLMPTHWNISIEQLHDRIDAVLRGEPLPPEDLKPLPPEVQLPRRIWCRADLGYFAVEFSQPTTPKSNAASSNVAATGSSSTITPDALTHGAGNDSNV